MSARGSVPEGAIRECRRCILDSRDDPELRLDAEGVCHYCRAYQVQAAREVFTGAEGEEKLSALFAEVRRAGRRRKYDCILGLSGGTDSTYLAYVARSRGLRPLAVHLDNGWNSELAVSNIEKIVKKLDLDLFTYVVNWEEFRDVQLAYLRASVIDIEAVTDHAILATVYRLAKQHHIRYILSGTNVVTEAVLPERWIFSKGDHVNLRAIHDRFGEVKLRTFPLLDWKLKVYCRYLLRVRSISPLNYIPYVRRNVHEVISRELEWRDYGVKHGESVFTRFYQGYILPRKFGVDKRKAHLSNLICSGQLTREDALRELQLPVYQPEQLRLEKAFVLKKLGLSNEQFEELMNQPVRSHSEFPTERPFRRHPLLTPLRRLRDHLRRSETTA